MTDLAHLRSLALSDLAAEAALNRELRRRDLPPEWSVHPSASPGACEGRSVVRAEGWGWVEGWVAPLAAPDYAGHVWRAPVFDGDAEVWEVAVYLSLAPREQTLCFASVDGRAEPSLRVYRGPGAQRAIDSDPRLYAALTHCPASLMVNEIRLGRACADAPPVRVVVAPLLPPNTSPARPPVRRPRRRGRCHRRGSPSDARPRRPAPSPGRSRPCVASHRRRPPCGGAGRGQHPGRGGLRGRSLGSCGVLYVIGMKHI